MGRLEKCWIGVMVVIVLEKSTARASSLLCAPLAFFLEVDSCRDTLKDPSLGFPSSATSRRIVRFFATRVHHYGIFNLIFCPTRSP